MLISNDQMEKRLNNPLNLINKLRSGELTTTEKRKNAMSLFIKPSFDRKVEKREEGVVSKVLLAEDDSIIPAFEETQLVPAQQAAPSSLVPKADDLMASADADIQLAKAHNDALGLMSTAMETLKGKMDNVKADKLPTVIAALGKVVTDIRRERAEREKHYGKDSEVHYHFYCPTQRKVDEYEVIEVSG